MNLLRPLMDRFFPPHQPLPAGIYHYQAPTDHPAPYRLHLRIEPNGSGVLIVNASTIVHLNNTASEYAYHLVQNTPEEEAIAEIARRYRTSKETVQRDYHDLKNRLWELISTPDLDPVTFLDFDRSALYADAGSAPYRLDCALTYTLPGLSQRPHAPEDRVRRELTGGEWKAVLEKAWNAGVPHVIFTGGEPTLRSDLCELIRHAESLGMVAGLITDGTNLNEASYLEELLLSGLDHIMLLLDPDTEEGWQALESLMVEDIAVVVHLTLSSTTQSHLSETINQLVTMGVQTVSLSADSPEMKDELHSARQAMADRQLRLVWDLPVPYSNFNPVAVEMAEESDEAELPEGAGQAWLYVEPDGDVLPGQGYYKTVLGNLLSDSWDTVWKAARAVKAV
jgi:organic radical activating enzyme